MIAPLLVELREPLEFRLKIVHRLGRVFLGGRVEGHIRRRFGGVGGGHGRVALAQLDQEWRDHFAETNIPMRASTEDEEKRQFMFDSLITGTSLQEHILEQVRLSEISDEQRPIAEMIVGNIDEYGYLKATIEELTFSTSIAPEKILEVLQIIQSFHPVGVGARDLRECLMLQMERLGRQKTIEYRIVNEYMDALGKRRMPEIARGLDEDVLDVQIGRAHV